MTHRASGGELRLPVPPEVLLVTAGIVLQFMSGHSSNYLLPVPLDRPLLIAGIALALYRALTQRRPWSPTVIHLLMAAFLGWVLISMAWSGSLSSTGAIFAWLDAVGLVPFALYLLAPLVFGTQERRRVLLGGLTLLGGYLGLIALLEGLGWYELVWPQYIYNPGSPHFGRAGGPARQVASNGMQLMGCAVAAAVFARGATRPWLGRAAWAVAALCLMGTFFTLTRSVWLGVFAGLVAAMLTNRRSIKPLLLGTAATGAFLALALIALPDLREAVGERLSDSRSAFDRLNANAAAIDIVLARPLHGIGFHQFAPSQADWLWQSPDIPVTSTGIAVHNVLLGYAAELGLPGAGLWLGCLVVAVISLWQSPVTDPDHTLLRKAALAYTVCWLIVGMLVPMTYALPATLLWLFLALPTSPRLLGFQQHHPADQPVRSHV